MEKEKILIVDDEPGIRNFMSRIVETLKYDHSEASNGEEALQLYMKDRADLILSDVRMPRLDGLGLLEQVRMINPEQVVIMVTAFDDSDTVKKALKAGAYDYINKPLDLDEVIYSIQRGMEKVRFLKKLKDYQDNLEKQVTKQTKRIKKVFAGALSALANALEAKDVYTQGHSKRVTMLAVEIAREMHLSPIQVEQIKLAGMFHDIGKIGIKDNILNKNGPLTPEEFAEIKKHPQIAVDIIGDLIDKEILDIVLYHHERYDGKGYPAGLKGEEIPLGARILAVADSWDAMTSERPYRKALPRHVAIEEIEKNAGTQFDPKIASVFLEIIAYGKDTYLPEYSLPGMLEAAN